MNPVYILLKSLLDPVILILVLLVAVFLLLTGFKYHRRLRIAQIMIILTALLLYGLSIEPTRNALFYPLEKDYFGQDLYKPPPLDAVVVLAGGAGEKPGGSETILTGETPVRLLHAVQIFRRSYADYFICSGAGAADAMAMIARRLGVPLSKTIIDEEARNTAEHAATLKEILPNTDMKIGVVTSAYHLRRSCREIRKSFSNVYPFPAIFYYEPRIDFTSFIPSSTDLYECSAAIREHIGNLWYRMCY